VVCSPNEWAKSVKASSSSTKMTGTKLLQQEFWSSLKDYMENNNTFLRLQKPRPQHWYSIAVGRSKFNISITVNTQKNKLGCELYIRGKNAKKAFALLKNEQQKIEDEIGEKLNWQELPKGQDCRIILYKNGNIHNRDEWNEYFQWYQTNAEKFHKAFSKRVKSLKL
jgi:hypothetical protein